MMKTYTYKQQERGEHYLEMLDRQLASGRVQFDDDVDGDDTQGAVTGKYRCGHCGARSNDPDFPETCCRQALIAAGLLDGGPC